MFKFTISGISLSPKQFLALSTSVISDSQEFTKCRRLIANIIGINETVWGVVVLLDNLEGICIWVHSVSSHNVLKSPRGRVTQMLSTYHRMAWLTYPYEFISVCQNLPKLFNRFDGEEATSSWLWISTCCPIRHLTRFRLRDFPFGIVLIYSMVLYWRQETPWRTWYVSSKR